jgi:tripartite ATP-independent transporter DctM subunit
LLRIWGGLIQNLILVAIPMFVFMGIMLERSGVAADLLQTLQELLHRIPGGLAIAVTVLGTILAATTGIIGASVVMLGILALPAMLENSYRTELALGVICASGTLGILIPPSIMLVLMGDLLSLPVGELFVGALLPGLLLSCLYIIYLVTVCTLRPSVAPTTRTRHHATTIHEYLPKVLRSLLPPLSMIALVLGSIFFGWATPTEASGVGALGATLLAIMHRRLNAGMLKEVVYRSAATVSMIFTILIGATTFSYVFRSLGGDDVVEELLTNLSLGPWGILLVVMGVIFLLGFFFDWLEITLIVLPLFAPIVGQLDFGSHFLAPRQSTIWFAVLVAINLQTSFLTPPFGFALFYLKGTCPPQITTGQLYRGVVPFIVIQLVGLALVIVFPSLVTWLPSVLFR